MATSLIENPQAVSAIYELLELDCTAEQVKELFEHLQSEILNGPEDEDMDCVDPGDLRGISLNND